ncbi:MAG: PDZ domain-containing protein [Deltaproteobacteria bacterium]|nr:PDZ domain-containing protein [Deltaproteobacteria bacterium]
MKYRTLLVFLALLIVAGCSKQKEEKPQLVSIPQRLDPALKRELRFPELITTISLLRANYYDPTKLKPSEMLDAGMDQLQTTIASVAWQKKSGEISVQVDSKSRNFPVKDIKTLGSLRDLGSDIIEFVLVEMKKQGASEDELEDALYGFINGMLSALDPYSVIIKPKLQDDFEMHTKGAYGGVGMVLSMKEWELTVVNPYKDQPAWNVGLREGDKILRIDDYSTVNMKLQHAVDLIRGPENTTVDIYIRQKDKKELKKFVVTRKRINIKSVSSKLLPGNILYLRIAHFIPSTVSDMTAKFKEAERTSGKVKGIILDLVENPGGLLPQSIHVANAFLEKGVIVSTEGAPGTQKKVFHATKENTITADTPMIVLVNGGSASASEIVSGSLKNLDRALIMGETTFGKGTVQQIFSKDKNFPILKMTIRQYLTAGDVSIQQVGVVPHVRVVPVGIFNGVSSLFWPDIPREIHKRTRAIKSDKVRPPEKPRYEIRYFKSKTEKRNIKNSVDDFAADPYLVDLARNILLKASGPTASSILEKATELIESVKANEEANLIEDLKKYQVDWATMTSSTLKPEISIEPRFCEVADKKCSRPVSLVLPGKETRFSIKVKNVSDRTASRLYAVIKSPASYLDQKEFLFGTLKKGQTGEWGNVFTIPERSADEVEPYTVVLYEATRGVISEKKFYLKSKRLPKPVLQISYAYTDEGPLSDGCLDNGEDVKIFMNVKNVGEGSASSPVLRLINHSGKRLYINEGRLLPKELKPGKETMAVFTFRAKDVSKPLKIELDVYDMTSRTGVSRTVILPQCLQKLKFTKEDRILQFDSEISGWSDPMLKGHMVGKLLKQYKILSSVKNVCKLQIPNGPDLFVNCNDGKPIDKMVSPGAVKWYAHIVPPVIRVSKFPEAITSKSQIQISGNVAHPEKIRDFYILVSSVESETGRKKVYFKAAKGAYLDFDAKIPLEKGLNNILLIGRYDKDLFSHVLFSVVRE